MNPEEKPFLPRKDALLRKLFDGQRGLPFGPIQPPAPEETGS